VFRSSERQRNFGDGGRIYRGFVAILAQEINLVVTKTGHNNEKLRSSELQGDQKSLCAPDGYNTE
jgi:hypothetical protein